MEDEDEELEDDFSDFQYFEAEPMILNLEDNSFGIVVCEETPQEDFETTHETTLETTLDTTLETDNKAMLESVSENIHEKLSSTLLGSNEIGSPSHVTNSSTMDYESIADGSSVNSFRRSTYVTQEATAISLVLGDTPELKKYDNTKHSCKQSKNSDYFLYNMLMDSSLRKSFCIKTGA